MPATEKVSVTLGREELRRAKQLALKLGLSLSTFINDAVRERIDAQARREAGLKVIETFPPEDRPSSAEMQALLARWRLAPGASSGRMAGKLRARAPNETRRRPRSL